MIVKFKSLLKLPTLKSQSRTPCTCCKSRLSGAVWATWRAWSPAWPPVERLRLANSRVCWRAEPWRRPPSVRWPGCRRARDRGWLTSARRGVSVGRAGWRCSSPATGARLRREEMKGSLTLRMQRANEGDYSMSRQLLTVLSSGGTLG